MAESTSPGLYIKLSITIELFDQVFPLTSSNVNVTEWRTSGGKPTAGTQDTIKKAFESLKFSFPPGYSWNGNLDTLINWFASKLDATVPPIIEDIFNDEITVSNVSVDGHGNFQAAFTIKPKDWELDPDGFEILKFDSLGLAIEHIAKPAN